MELSVSPSSRSSSSAPATGMRSVRLSSDTRRAVPVMCFSGASTLPATAQPITAASSSTPMNASAY